LVQKWGDVRGAHPTHLLMAAKVGLDAALSFAEQRDTLAAAAAANGSSWLPIPSGLNYSLSMRHIDDGDADMTAERQQMLAIT
jgi:hypothetical protein